MHLEEVGVAEHEAVYCTDRYKPGSAMSNQIDIPASFAGVET